MIGVTKAARRQRADLEQRFMRAIEIAVPAALDSKAKGAFTRRLKKLQQEINGETDAGA